MAGDLPKKMASFCILRILIEHTDGEEDENGKKIHSLKQKEIQDLLEREYGLKYGRKAISRCLDDLAAFDERIRYVETDKKESSGSDGETSANRTDFWYDHAFEKTELQLIIYNIIFGRHIPRNYKRDLVEKLEGLLPLAFKHKMKNFIIEEDPSYKGDFSQLFMNMEDLDAAITKRQPVSFRVSYYKPDKTTYVSKVEFIVMPLAIVAGKGDLYLLACPYALKGVSVEGERKFSIRVNPAEDQDEDTVYFIDNLKASPKKVEDLTFTMRLDRIRDLQILDRTELKGEKDMLRAFEKRGGVERSQEHAAVNASLALGRTITATFRLTTRVSGTFSRTLRKDCDLTTVIDYFGKPNVTIAEEGMENTPQGKQVKYFIRVKTNDGALREFAKANIESVQILTPDYMREELRQTLKTAYERMLAAENDDAGVKREGAMAERDDAAKGDDVAAKNDTAGER